MQWFPILHLSVCWSLPLYHLNLLLVPSSVFLFQLLYLQLYLVPYIFSLLNCSLFVSGSSNLSSVLKNTFYVCLSLSTVRKKKWAQDICKFMHRVQVSLLWLSLLWDYLFILQSPEPLFLVFLIIRMDFLLRFSPSCIHSIICCSVTGIYPCSKA